VEQDQQLGAVLASRGGQAGYVNAIACPSGLRSGADTCRAAIDPASDGLALTGR
jgi:gamma-glutamyltranspeptidase/glutathione hydrolase